MAKAKYSDAQVTQFVSFFCSLLHQTGLSNLQDAKSKLKKKYPAQYEKLFQLVNPAIEKLKKASSQTKTKQKKSGSSTESKAAVPNPPVLNKKSMGKIRDDLNKAIYSKLGSEGFSVPRIGKIASIALAQIAEPNYLQKIWAASQKIDDPDAKKMYELIKPLARETRKKIDQSGSESNQT